MTHDTKTPLCGGYLVSILLPASFRYLQSWLSSQGQICSPWMEQGTLLWFACSDLLPVPISTKLSVRVLMHLKPWGQHETRVVVDTAFRNPARLGKEHRSRSLDHFALGWLHWSVANEISQDAYWADAWVDDSFFGFHTEGKLRNIYYTAILPPFRWSQPMHSKHPGGSFLDEHN